MPSGFSALELQAEDRPQTLDVPPLPQGPKTLDELGIGTIRDAFADYFFPGTNIAQTRARYMLFVPWIYLELERQRVLSDGIAQRARSDEIRLITALLQSDDTEGVIGKGAKEGLRRLPSSIYWTGLGSWGIRLFKGSQALYHRMTDTFYWRQEPLPYDSERPVVRDVSANWDPALPAAPQGLLDAADLRLTKDEAEYLRERIAISHRDSLLAFLITASSPAEPAFLWEHPVVPSLPGDAREDVAHARNFSEALHGASLLYNLLLARQVRNEEWVDGYTRLLGDWSDALASRWSQLVAWHRRRRTFWGSPALRTARIPHATRTFVIDWLDLVFGRGDKARPAENPDAQALVRDREAWLKGSRARLRNPQALARWRGASGVAQLDFRWRTARTLVRDIVEGLHRTDREGNQESL